MMKIVQSKKEIMTIIKQFLLLPFAFLVKQKAYGNDNAERSRICSTYDDQMIEAIISKEAKS